MKRKIWLWLTRRHAENTILSNWHTFIRWVLFPIDTTFWKMSKRRGYQPETAQWVIGDVKIGQGALNALEQASGVELFKITNTEKGLAVKQVLGIDDLYQIDPFSVQFHTLDELHRIREWFDCIQDVNPKYLQKKDYEIALNIYKTLGMRVPNSIKYMSK